MFEPVPAGFDGLDCSPLLFPLVPLLLLVPLELLLPLPDELLELLPVTPLLVPVPLRMLLVLFVVEPVPSVLLVP